MSPQARLLHSFRCSLPSSPKRDSTSTRLLPSAVPLFPSGLTVLTRTSLHFFPGPTSLNHFHSEGQYFLPLTRWHFPRSWPFLFLPVPSFFVSRGQPDSLTLPHPTPRYNFNRFDLLFPCRRLFVPFVPASFPFPPSPNGCNLLNCDASWFIGLSIIAFTLHDQRSIV